MNKFVFLLKQKGVDQRSIATACGVTPQAVSLWAKSGVVPVRKIPTVSALLGVTTDTLLNPDLNVLDSSSADSTVRDGFIRVPILDAEMASPGSPIVEVATGSIDLAEWFVRSWGRVVKTNKLQILSARGDDMTPTIGVRSLVVIDRNQNVVSGGGGVFCLQVGKTIFIKRVQQNLDGTFSLLSDNKDYPTQVVDKETWFNTKVLGRVVYVLNGSVV